LSIAILQKVTLNLLNDINVGFKINKNKMEHFNKNHWEGIYQNKSSNEVSWTEETPWVIDEILPTMHLPFSSNIIDIGAGEGQFSQSMFNKGYTKLTVLDIASSAIEKAKQHFGSNAPLIQWKVANVLEVNFEKPFDLWYDRAVFHFLTSSDDIKKYVEQVNRFANQYVIIGTFALDGPIKCSGLPIVQYSSEKLYALFESTFILVNSYAYVHRTPFGTNQSFQFVLMKKK
jgi:hypothetical protein